MVWSLKSAFAFLLLASAGCLWDDPDLRDNRVRLEGGRQQLPEGSRDANMRADTVFNPLIANNQDLGFQPRLVVIGVPKLSLFHDGTTALYISEGVINRCKTDSELAAVFASELGKMAVEDDARRGETIVSTGDRPLTQRDRPFTPRVTGGGNDLRADADMTSLATQGYWERETPQRDPQLLARRWLSKAGYVPDDLGKVGTLVRQAEANPEYESRIRKPTQDMGTPKQ